MNLKWIYFDPRRFSFLRELTSYKEEIITIEWRNGFIHNDAKHRIYSEWFIVVLTSSVWIDKDIFAEMLWIYSYRTFSLSSCIGLVNARGTSIRSTSVRDNNYKNDINNNNIYMEMFDQSSYDTLHVIWMMIHLTIIFSQIIIVE